MTKLFLIASTVLSLATAPAIAREARPAAASASPSTDAAVPSATPSATQRYCVRYSVTGSRIPVKTCKTRRDWIADEGFDPLAK